MQLKSAIIAAAAMLLSLTSCKTPGDITYFQDVTAGQIIEAGKQLDIRIKPEDKLSILVSTQDPALSSMFNLVQSQNTLRTTGVSSTGSVSSDGRTSYYTVNSFGDIQFPVLGTLRLAGMTRTEATDYIENRLKQENLVKDPIVTIEFANTGISILGDVARPGRFEFNKDRLNLLDAIAMAGDLQATGQRRNVMVLREQADGKKAVYKVDLTDMASVADSPAYYLQQNDIVYVEPNDKKKRETTASGNSAFTPSFWISVGSLGITVATLIISLTNLK